MTVNTDGRLGLHSWTASTDPFTRAQMTADHVAIGELAAIDRQGTLAARPAAGVRGTYYSASDTGQLFRDNGATWVEVPTLPGGALRVGATARTSGDTADARLAVSTDNSGTAGVAVQGATGQTAPAVRLVTSAGLETLEVAIDGSLAAGRSLTAAGYWTIRPDDGTERGLHVDHVDAPTADLLRLSTDGTRRVSVDPKGRIYLAALSDSATPSTPTGAGVIFCDAVGRLKYRGPGGTTTTLAER